MDAIVGVTALLFGGALLRVLAKNRWLLFLTIVLWGALLRQANRMFGSEGLLFFGVLTALLVVTALLLPWLGKLKPVMIAKGTFIVLWRRMIGLARVAEAAAKTETKKE